MTTVRVTQAVIETAYTEDAHPVQVTQTIIETAYTEDAHPVQVTQAVIEVGFVVPRRRRVILTHFGN